MDCGRYTPGHRVHWIQWRKVREEDDMQPARVVDADVRQQTIVLEVGGERFKAWNHDVGRIVDQADTADAVTYSPRWRVLQCDASFHYLATEEDDFEPRCAAPAEEETADADGFLARLREFGGVTARLTPYPAENASPPEIDERPEVHAAIEAVRLLTGLGAEDAAVVVLDDDHSRYDGSGVGLLDDPDEPLETEVRNVVADCLDVDTVAGALSVATLLVAMKAGFASAYGDTIELRLLDDRLVLTGENDWGHIEVRNEEGGVDLVPTGIEGDCCDPLTVARALARVAPRHPDDV